jgi:ADP-ribosyl-[dinitrogen reductase] hydrolase
MTMKNTLRKSNNESTSQASKPMRIVFERAMLAGAIGDAYGLPLEFLSGQKIKQAGYDLKNINDQLRFLGKSSDDTQLNLFTAEGIIKFRYNNIQNFREYKLMNDSIVVEVARAYQRWLHTQGEQSIFCEEIDVESGLVSYPELNQRVEPGYTCISSLKDMQHHSDIAFNFSNGSGATIKNLPLAMFYASATSDNSPLSIHQKALASFDLGFKVAQITHGHPIAKLAAAAISCILFFNLHRGPSDGTLVYSMAMTRELMINNQASILSCAFDIDKSHLKRVVKLLDYSVYTATKNVSDYGQGWCADEALAISLYCARHSGSFEQLLVMSACHGGDSDSTSSLAASIFVSARGGEDIPNYLLERLELRNVVLEVTNKFTS